MTSAPSLRRKLLSWLLVPLLFLWLVGGVGAYYLAINFSTLAYDRSLLDLARALAEQVKVINGRVVVPLPPVAQRILATGDHNVCYQVRDGGGAVISGDPVLHAPPAARRPGGVMRDGEVRGQPVRIAAIWVPVHGAPSPVVVQLAERMNQRDILAQEILSSTVLPQLLLIALAGAIVWFGVERALIPLQKLRREVGDRSYRNLSPLDETCVCREVRPLVVSINALLVRLGTALEAQQRFIADAAHQLRTPLAGLKTQTDVALRLSRPEEVHHALEQLDTSSRRAIRLVNQMLALARVEPDAAQGTALSSLELNRVAREAAAEWASTALLGKNIDLGFEAAPHPVTVIGDSVRLRMLLDNLLDNAIRYAPPGSRVTVRVTGGEEIALMVEDNGPGIPEAERERVFQRFYRVLDNGADGSGLGLAIVWEIAMLHGARVILGSGAGGRGALVKVVFPPVI